MTEGQSRGGFIHALRDVMQLEEEGMWDLMAADASMASKSQGGGKKLLQRDV